MAYSTNIEAAVAEAADYTSNANGYSSERLFITTPRGIQSTSINGDRGYRAYIRLMTTTTVNVSDTSTYSSSIAGTGNPLDQAVNGSASYGGYSSFLLTGMQANMSEKMQVTETFGDGEVYYYFGRQPIVFSFSGMLIDSNENDWLTQWLYMYSQVLRGTALATNYQLIKLVLPNMTLIGTISGMSFSQDSNRDTDIPFQFQFMAKQLIPTPVSLLGSAFSPDASSINFSSSSDFLSQAGINSTASTISSYYSVIQNPTSSSSSIASSLASLGSTVSGTVESSVAALNSVAAATSYTSSVVAYNASYAFYGLTVSLAGARASLFSPVYGVLSSLTKLISAVSTTVASVYNSVISPINAVIRDVTSIEAQAVGLVNMVDFAAANLVGATLNTEAAVLATIGAIENTVGTIVTAPQTLFSYMQALVAGGRLSPNAAFLQNKAIASLSSSTASIGKSALLSSGVPFTAEVGASL